MASLSLSTVFITKVPSNSNLYRLLTAPSEIRTPSTNHWNFGRGSAFGLHCNVPSWPWRKWKGPNWWLSKDGFQAEEKQIVPKEINWNYSCSDIVWCSADKSEVRFSLCSKESFSNERPQSRILLVLLYFALSLILKTRAVFGIYQIQHHKTICSLDTRVSFVWGFGSRYRLSPRVISLSCTWLLSWWNLCL